MAEKKIENLGDKIFRNIANDRDKKDKNDTQNDQSPSDSSNNKDQRGSTPDDSVGNFKPSNLVFPERPKIRVAPEIKGELDTELALSVGNFKPSNLVFPERPKIRVAPEIKGELDTELALSVGNFKPSNLVFPERPKIRVAPEIKGELDTELALSVGNLRLSHFRFPDTPKVSVKSLDDSSSLHQTSIQSSEKDSENSTIVSSDLTKSEVSTSLDKNSSPSTNTNSTPNPNSSSSQESPVTSPENNPISTPSESQSQDQAVAETSSSFNGDIGPDMEPFKNFFDLGGSLLISEGNIIIVYDEQNKNIEDSLAYISEEISYIHNRTYNHVNIARVEDINQYYRLSNVGLDEDIFVLKKELCDDKDGKALNVLKEPISGVTGKRHSIIIIPDCLFGYLSPGIGGKPKRVIEVRSSLKTAQSSNPLSYEVVNLTKEEILAWAYMSSGLQARSPNGYGALGDVNMYFYQLLDKAFEWLRTRYPELDRPSKAGEPLTRRKLAAFTIKYLIESGISPSQIRVGEPAATGPDITVGDKLIYVKTSAGRLPGDEIWEVKDDVKRRTYQGFREAWIIMRPIAVLLDYHAVSKMIEQAEKEGLKIKVMVPVQNGLITLEELLTRGKDMLN